MNYIFVGRFQPFSNANIEELKWLISTIKPNDYIIFGIVNPNPNKMDIDEEAREWKRFQPVFNPLSFWHRYEIIKIASKLLSCQEKIKAIVPLPTRPSVDMRKLENFLPRKGMRKICIPRYFFDDAENEKVIGTKKQGEEILQIPAHSFEPLIRGVSPELISCLVALSDDKWEEFVHPQIISYLQENNYVKNVTDILQSQIAKETLEHIYNNYNEETKEVYQDIIGKYLPKNTNLNNRNITFNVKEMKIERSIFHFCTFNEYNGAEKEILDIIDNAKLALEEKKELISYLDSIKKGEKNAKNNKLKEFLKGLGINLTSGIIASYMIAKGL